MNEHVAVGGIWLLGILCTLAAWHGCLDVPLRPACSPRALDALEARYVAEVAEACPVRGPCAELPAIERRYEAEREAWIRCR